MFAPGTFARPEKGFRLLVSLFVLVTVHLHAETPAADPLAEIQARVRSSFDQLLEQPKKYAELATKESLLFPEGDLFPYVFPALGYSHVAQADPSQTSNSLKRMQTLIRLCIPCVAGRVEAPDGDLMQLDDYGGYATHLGQLNLVLSHYRNLGGNDADLLRLNDKLSEILLKALEKSRGEPLNSYPGLLWPFDTVPGLVSLVRWGGEVPRVIKVKEQHLKWLHDLGLNQVYQLPYSHGVDSLPRGCDLSLRIPLLKELDRSAADKYYKQYRKLFWLERGAFAGFAEWPEGMPGQMDADSGPILDGLGMAATGNGLAVVRAMGDAAALEKLSSELQMRDGVVAAATFNQQSKKLIEVTFDSLGLQFAPEYFTGFFFGDAVLFGVITWPGNK